MKFWKCSRASDREQQGPNSVWDVLREAAAPMIRMCTFVPGRGPLTLPIARDSSSRQGAAAYAAALVVDEGKPVVQSLLTTSSMHASRRFVPPSAVSMSARCRGLVRGDGHRPITSWPDARENRVVLEHFIVDLS